MVHLMLFITLVTADGWRQNNFAIGLLKYLCLFQIKSIQSVETPVNNYEDVLKLMVNNVQGSFLDTIRKTGINSTPTTTKTGCTIPNKTYYWMTSDEIAQKEKEKEDEKKLKEKKTEESKAKRLERDLNKKRKKLNQKQTLRKSQVQN
jgi:hypothetical protein